MLSVWTGPKSRRLVKSEKTQNMNLIKQFSSFYMTEYVQRIQVEKEKERNQFQELVRSECFIKC